LQLSKGGTQLVVNGGLTIARPLAEYEGIYEHFAALLKSSQSHVDGAPLQLVSDCLMLGRHIETEAFS
jgi:D-galactose 1-dehydrogenase